MELTDLCVFQAVARHGGVTSAAVRLNKVQSGISARIQKLEVELGTALFARQGRRMVLTASGRTLLDYADKILLLSAEAASCVRGEIFKGPLRLGAMESTSASRLPRLLGEYHRRYPDVALELSTATTEELIRDVAGYALDAAFVSEPVTTEGLERRQAYAEELVLASAAGHTPIREPGDLGTGALLVFKRGCAYRRRLEDWTNTQPGQTARRVVELGSYQTMLGCAASGMGVAIMPRSVAELMPGSPGVSLHELPPEYAKAVTSLIWKQDNATEPLKALVRMLEASVREE